MIQERSGWVAKFKRTLHMGLEWLGSMLGGGALVLSLIFSQSQSVLDLGQEWVGGGLVAGAILIFKNIVSRAYENGQAIQKEAHIIQSEAHDRSIQMASETIEGYRLALSEEKARATVDREMFDLKILGLTEEIEKLDTKIKQLEEENADLHRKLRLAGVD